MAHNPIADDMLRKAEEAQAARLVPIRELADSAARIGKLRDQLAEAEGAGKAAYSGALKAGWTSAELKSMGVEEGGIPAASTRRRAAAKRVDAATSFSSPSNEE